MTERTRSNGSLDRAELASHLTELAEEFDGEGGIGVGVGNKRVRLHPPENVECTVEVIERSSRLRGSRETVSIELSWKPNSTD